MPSPTDVQISVITVTYRSAHSAAACLEATAGTVAAFGEQVEWIVVDNSEDASDEGLLLTLRDGLPSMRILRRPSNPGFAASCNEGASAAAGAWLLLVNPDIYLTREVLGAVAETVRRADDSVAAFAIGQSTRGRRHLGIGLLFGAWFFDRSPQSRTRLLGPSGGLAALERSRFLRVGGFDEQMFAWGEDVDLAFRMRREGWRCEEVEAFAEHLGGHSVSSPEAQSLKAYLLGRNRQVVAWRHYSLTRLAWMELLSLAVYAARLPAHLRQGSFPFLWRGLVEGVQIGRAERSRRSPGHPGKGR